MGVVGEVGVVGVVEVAEVVATGVAGTAAVTCGLFDLFCANGDWWSCHCTNNKPSGSLYNTHVPR